MNKYNGISLIELMISLLIISIVSVIGVLMLVNFREENCMQTVANEISSAIQFTKTISILKAKTVVLMPINHDAEWSKGMCLVFEDDLHHDANTVRNIREWHWNFDKFLKVSWHGFESDQYLRFSPNFVASPIANGYFTLQSLHNPLKITLMVNRLGRIKKSMS